MSELSEAMLNNVHDILRNLVVNGITNSGVTVVKDFPAHVRKQLQIAQLVFKTYKETETIENQRPHSWQNKSKDNQGIENAIGWYTELLQCWLNHLPPS